MCLGQRFRKLVGALWEMGHRQSGIFREKSRDTSQAIGLFGITVVIKGKYQVSTSFADHAITRRDGSLTEFMDEQPRVGQFGPNEFHGAIRATIRRDQNLERRRFEVMQRAKSSLQILEPVP